MQKVNVLNQMSYFIMLTKNREGDQLGFEIKNALTFRIEQTNWEKNNAFLRDVNAVIQPRLIWKNEQFT